MITKPYLAKLGLPLLAASTFVVPFAAPSAVALVAIGEHADLFFNGSATVRANDNVFLEESGEESDVLLVFSPGLELNVGSGGNANVNLFYRHDFYRYNDNDVLDNDYSNLFLESYWNQARLDLRFNASYEELAQADPQINDLIERDYTRANLHGEYEFGEKTSASLGVDTTFIRFDTDAMFGFADRDIIGVPVNFYYELTPLVDLSVGYRYRETDVDGPVDYEDHYFNVGARGELAPKLIGEGRIGFQERDVDGADGESGLSFGLDLSHFTTPRTTLTAGLFRDFEASGRGSSLTALGGNIGVRHEFSHLISGQAGVSYSEREWDTAIGGDFSGREDERLDFNLGVTYSPNQYLDISGGYVFRTNDSNIDQLDYDNNIFSLSAALRY